MGIFGVPGHLGPHIIYRWNRLDPRTHASPGQLARLRSHARARREKLDMVAKLKLNMVANLKD